MCAAVACIMRWLEGSGGVLPRICFEFFTSEVASEFISGIYKYS